MEKSVTGKRGMFIVLDGIDGSGKSTQAKLLEAWLKKRGEKVLMMHEPSSDSPLGKRIKRLVRERKKSISASKWVELFSRERRYQMKGLKKALSEGKIVISDRYYYSTMAYQLDEKRWKAYAKKFVKPDLALILDLPIGEALKRINKKNAERHLRIAVFERALFLSEVKAKFLMIGKNFREAKVINSEKSPSAIFKELKSGVEKTIR